MRSQPGAVEDPPVQTLGGSQVVPINQGEQGIDPATIGVGRQPGPAPQIGDAPRQMPTPAGHGIPSFGQLMSSGQGTGPAPATETGPSAFVAQQSELEAMIRTTMEKRNALANTPIEDDDSKLMNFAKGAQYGARTALRSGADTMTALGMMIGGSLRGLFKPADDEAREREEQIGVLDKDLEKQNKSLEGVMANQMKQTQVEKARRDAEWEAGRANREQSKMDFDREKFEYQKEKDRLDREGKTAEAARKEASKPINYKLSDEERSTKFGLKSEKQIKGEAGASVGKESNRRIKPEFAKYQNTDGSLNYGLMEADGVGASDAQMFEDLPDNYEQRKSQREGDLTKAQGGLRKFVERFETGVNHRKPPAGAPTATVPELEGGFKTLLDKANKAKTKKEKQDALRDLNEFLDGISLLNVR